MSIAQEIKNVNASFYESLLDEVIKSGKFKENESSILDIAIEAENTASEQKDDGSHVSVTHTALFNAVKPFLWLPPLT